MPASGPGGPVRLLFVSGTGTGVGKTFVTARIVGALRRRGLPAAGAKPIESGFPSPGAAGSDVAALARASGGAAVGNVYTLRRPASPHLAARLDGVEIDPAQVLSVLTTAAETGLLLVEGAGGLRVPLRPGYEMIDLARDLGAPVLLVARAGLGTLNETLLSLEALVRRGLPLAGTVLNCTAPVGPGGEDPDIVADNRDYLAAHAPGGVLGLLPYQAGEADVEAHLDLDRLLRALG